MSYYRMTIPGRSVKFGIRKPPLVLTFSPVTKICRKCGAEFQTLARGSRKKCDMCREGRAA